MTAIVLFDRRSQLFGLVGNTELVNEPVEPNVCGCRHPLASSGRVGKLLFNDLFNALEIHLV